MAEPVLCALASCRVPGREHTDGCDEQGCLCLRARAQDGGRLCALHTRRIGDDARECATLYDELEPRLLGGLGGGDKVSGTADTTRLPNPAVVDLRAEIRHVLVGWCRLVAEQRGFSLPRDNLTEIAAYVANSNTWLAAGDYADEVASELFDLRRRAWSLAYPTGTRRVPVPMPGGGRAHCLVDGCDGVVWGLIRPADMLELGSWLVCDADDGHRWPPSQWAAFGRAVKGRAA